MQSQEADKVKEIEEEVDKIEETTIIVDKADKIIKITTAIKEIIVDKVDHSQETIKDDSTTNSVGSVNKKDTIIYLDVHNSQIIFQGGTMRKVLQEIFAKNVWGQVETHANITLLLATKNSSVLPLCKIS